MARCLQSFRANQRQSVEESLAMSIRSERPKGLTRVIFESMLELTPEVLENGECWSPELLSQVKRQLHRRLAPEGSGRERIIFDMVFRRAFSEAGHLIQEVFPPAWEAQRQQALAVHS